MHGAHAYESADWGHLPSRREQKRAFIAAMQAGERGRRGPSTGRGDFGGWGGFSEARFGRGRRMRRGDVRTALLVLLDEEPRNGYQLMQEIEERSNGVWRPSPGSVYPALSQLEDEMLIAADESGAGKVFTLTAAGSKYVEENREKLGEPWANLSDGVGEQRLALRDQIKPLMAAVGQVMHSGTEVDNHRAAEILADARRKVYALLAEDSTNEEADRKAGD